ncbi:ATP-dependent DNA helicase RecG [Luteolibacter marinus]|uniref:ATP-dependent DNA helicase RecG n=1 Tax=Luteolibacter marinus TaxID=2776705 RepID=UPI001D0184F5|nr:ATP-dependent DNA helicase RecG [Luteolibacter marinus]
MIRADTALADVDSIDAKEAASLAAAGLHRVADLLGWLPRRYEDRRRFDAFPAQPGGPAVCLRGTVIDAAKRQFGGRRGFYEIVVIDGTGGVFGSAKISCRWFNMPFMHRMVLAGHEIILYGKPKGSKGKLVIDHPDFEIVRDDGTQSIHLERIVPVYRNVSGIPQRRLREILHHLSAHTDPASLTAPFDVDPTYPRHEAVKEVHFPEAIEQAEAARRRFALEEFFALQLNVVWRRARVMEHRGRVQGKKTGLLKAFYESLPFDLTGAQKRSIREIIADLRTPRPMNRLLQGDVGSGKTFVAMASMLLAVDSGCQAALMAPTQILAEQHFLTFSKWLEPLGIRITLRTAAKEESTHLPMQGEAQILIGTHALLYDKVAFRDLGLIVIDEQHKFGVTQRGRLIEQGTTPDVLVMTATPIPRTLTMTIYGDLDVSILDERPAGRGKMVTALRTGAKQTDITRFVKDQLKEGRQAYLVYPLVEESEALKAESATAAYEKWQKRLSAWQVGLVHGKLDAEAKEDVMRRFRDGELQALVATSVIEVGVDVPNANLMLIHHAERFGLAQLHQLRGRIGRGEHKSYCVLLTDGKSAEAMEKLQVMEKTSDGFVIAEEDLRLRGPGDVLGTLQSGLGDLKFADFLADTALLREARALADEVIRTDPTLTGRHAGLTGLIQQEPVAATRRD